MKCASKTKYRLARKNSKLWPKQFKTIYKNKKSHYTLHNTNTILLKQYHDIALSKTGFTNKAGRCLALFVERGAGKYVIVILGEPTPEKRQKIAKELITMIN